MLIPVMATALGSVVAAPCLHSRSFTVKNSFLRSGSDRDCSSGRRRSLHCKLGLSLSRRGLSGNVRQSRDFFPGPAFISWGDGVQSPAVHRGVCAARAGGKVSGIGAVAVEQPSLVVGKDEAEEGKTEYNWRTEWYPLYLINEVPRDAPLAVRVYDHDLVLFYDGNGKLNCFEDQCPHRAAKLSDGQVIDGTLECLYHGWQFRGDGACVKIPQLPAGAVIPRTACARSYALKESQDVVWVWMGDKSTADESKVPWFDSFAEEGFTGTGTIHEFPYDHSVLVENVLDPAHVHIAHDRTDFTAKREKAEALKFDVVERTDRGFAVNVTPASSDNPFIYRFQAPSIVSNTRYVVDKNGAKQTAASRFLIRPTGQGKCVILIFFGATMKLGGLFSLLPTWIFHMLQAKIFEQDMIFLAAQNETMVRKGLPLEDIYLNLRSSDTMVMEYRKWLDKVGQGMPYYFGHKTVFNSPTAAMQERAPAGLEAYSVSTQPSKGAFGHVYSRDTTNRYFRHIIHCKSCRTSLGQFRQSKKVFLALAALCSAGAIMLSNSKWKAGLVLSALLLAAFSWASSRLVDTMTQNFIRPHRKQ